MTLSSAVMVKQPEILVSATQEQLELDSTQSRLEKSLTPQEHHQWLAKGVKGEDLLLPSEKSLTSQGHHQGLAQGVKGADLQLPSEKSRAQPGLGWASRPSGESLASPEQPD
jgi:hypothetical protein